MDSLTEMLLSSLTDFYIVAELDMLWNAVLYYQFIDSSAIS